MYPLSEKIPSKQYLGTKKKKVVVFGQMAKNISTANLKTPIVKVFYIATTLSRNDHHIANAPPLYNTQNIPSLFIFLSNIYRSPSIHTLQITSPALNKLFPKLNHLKKTTQTPPPIHSITPFFTVHSMPPPPPHRMYGDHHPSTIKPQYFDGPDCHISISKLPLIHNFRKKTSKQKPNY